MNLFEINAEIEAILNDITYDEETGECFFDEERLNELEMMSNIKRENVALAYINTKSDWEQVYAQRRAFQKREERLKNKMDRLKDYLNRACDGEGFSTDKVEVRYRRSNKVELIDDFANEEYGSYSTIFKPDKDAIKNALKRGVEIEGAALVVNNNISIK